MWVRVPPEVHRLVLELNEDVVIVKLHQILSCMGGGHVTITVMGQRHYGLIFIQTCKISTQSDMGQVV